MSVASDVALEKRRPVSDRYPSADQDHSTLLDLLMTDSKQNTSARDLVDGYLSVETTYVRSFATKALAEAAERQSSMKSAVIADVLYFSHPCHVVQNHHHADLIAREGKIVVILKYHTTVIQMKSHARNAHSLLRSHASVEKRV